MTVYVYAIKHVISGKQYVGQTAHLNARWHGHKASAAQGNRYPLYRDMRRDGVDAFEMRVLEECDTRAAALAAEEVWIRRLRTTDPSRGYNINLGAKPTWRNRLSGADDELKALIRAQALDMKR